MALFSISECLENIFSKLVEHPSSDTSVNISTKDLYSCTLVSRHWCRTSTPFLYAYPFHHFRNIGCLYDKHYYYKLIRTLLSCTPQFEIKQNYMSYIIKPISSSKISSTFNYISFIRGLIVNEEMMLNLQNICGHKRIWLSARNPENTSSEITVRIMNYLVEFLCKHCNNLTILEFLLAVEDNESLTFECDGKLQFLYSTEDFEFHNTIELLTFDCDGESQFSDLKELYYNNRSYSLSALLQRDLYFSLSDDICNLNLLCNERISSDDEAYSLSQFISLQKKLKHLILLADEYEFYNNYYGIYYNIVFNSLSTQCESLQILEFENVGFEYIDAEVINSLCSLKNIRELKLNKCRDVDNLHSWAKNLINLEVFELVIDWTSGMFEDFLIELFESSSNLSKLVTSDDDDEFIQLFQQQLFCLSSLTHLELSITFPYELISVFQSCTKLVYLNVSLSKERLSKSDLRNLGRFVPKTLKKIQFRKPNYLKELFYLLECFLEDLNYDCTLKYLKYGCDEESIYVLSSRSQ